MSTKGRETGEAGITALKAKSVMCEITKCERPALFLVRYKSGALQAVCEKHVEAIGLAESAALSAPTP
jgi:hypothetical protein